MLHVVLIVVLLTCKRNKIQWTCQECHTVKHVIQWNVNMSKFYTSAKKALWEDLFLKKIYFQQRDWRRETVTTLSVFPDNIFNTEEVIRVIWTHWKAVKACHWLPKVAGGTRSLWGSVHLSQRHVGAVLSLGPTVRTTLYTHAVAIYRYLRTYNGSELVCSHYMALSTKATLFDNEASVFDWNVTASLPVCQWLFQAPGQLSHSRDVGFVVDKNIVCIVSLGGFPAKKDLPNNHIKLLTWSRSLQF